MAAKPTETIGMLLAVIFRNIREKTDSEPIYATLLSPEVSISGNNFK
jgi:hypothetical protein